MPFVTNRGVRIHYETIGNGPALVMHHGTFGSGADFIDLGYVDAFKADHQVILPDSRGHGRSDKPHDSNSYDPALRASVVLAVLNKLGIRKADYFGYSLGGWIGFDLAIRAPERFGSFIFGGCHPCAENMQPFRDLMPRDPEAFAALIDRAFGSRLASAMPTRLLANDFDALRELTQNRESNAAALPSMTMPCLLFVGELDRVSPKRGSARRSFRMQPSSLCQSAITLLRSSAARSEGTCWYLDVDFHKPAEGNKKRATLTRHLGLSSE